MAPKWPNQWNRHPTAETQRFSIVGQTIPQASYPGNRHTIQSPGRHLTHRFKSIPFNPPLCNRNVSPAISRVDLPTGSYLLLANRTHHIMSRRVPNPAAERAAQNTATIKSLLKLEPNKVCADCKRNKRKCREIASSSSLAFGTSL